MPCRKHIRHGDIDSHPVIAHAAQVFFDLFDGYRIEAGFVSHRFVFAD
jgi:hypothetical protein